MNSTNNCFVYPYTTVSASTGFTNPDYSVTWTRTSSASASTSSLPATITYGFSGSTKPMINSMRIWPYSSASMNVRSFTLEGSMSTTSSWEMISSVSDAEYTGYQWQQWDRVQLAPQYSLLRFRAQSAQSISAYLYEIQFMICNRQIPSVIDYQEASYSYMQYYDYVSIIPQSYGYYGCSISPSLPDGVSIDPNTCIISGRSNVVSPMTSYQVTAQMATAQSQVTISLAFMECAGTYYKIVRTYKTSPQSEFFRIRDSSNDNIVYQIQSGHSHPASQDWTHYLCITVDRFDVIFDSTSTYWTSDSYFYMYSLLPDGEEEMVLKGRYDSFEGNEHDIYLHRPVINHSEQWYYKMGEVPNNWFGDEHQVGLRLLEDHSLLLQIVFSCTRRHSTLPH